MPSDDAASAPPRTGTVRHAARRPARTATRRAPPGRRRRVTATGGSVRQV
ncbi:hypothetical protein ACWDUH_01910 [Micromonospora wenchangensis]